MRKTWVALYRSWISPHKDHRSLRKRFRQHGNRDVAAGLDDLQDEEDEFWQEFAADQRRWNG